MEAALLASSRMLIHWEMVGDGLPSIWLPGYAIIMPDISMVPLFAQSDRGMHVIRKVDEKVVQSHQLFQQREPMEESDCI